ncbi:MAG: carbohydrate kinase family protein [Anaerolineae bacterium]|nr:carbohydrate kinase family protein [Anaerolineae bacterium]
MTHLLIIGAASLDTKGRASQPIQAGTSTPGAIRISAGGVARNIAENLARLGEPVVLLSAVGNDSSGRRILSQAAEIGIDVSHVVVEAGHRTAAYLAVLDETGNMAASIDDMAISQEVLTPQLLYRHRNLFRDARMIALDANLSPAALRTIFSLARKYNVPVCADPTTTTLAPRLCPYLPELLLITPNSAEAEALCGVHVHGRRSALTAAKKLVTMGVQIAVITLGATGLAYATSQESGNVPAIECDIVDMTGAGDALTAGAIFGLLNDLPVDQAVRLGLSAAALTLQSRETVHPDLSLEHLYDKLQI